MKLTRILSFSLASVLMLGAVSCKKDFDIKTPMPASEFATSTSAAKDYFVEPTNDPYKIPIGLTTPLDRDVTINFVYSSETAVEGTHYTGPKTLVIPAGKVLDTLEVTGIFANIPVGVSHKLGIKISGGELPTVIGRDSIVLNLTRFCPVDVLNMNGNYAGTAVSQYDGALPAFTATLSNMNQITATTAKGTLDAFHPDYGSLSVDIVFDWTDKTNFKVYLDPATQTQPYTYSGAPTFVEIPSGTVSTFSSCSNTITTGFRFYTGAGTFDNWTLKLQK